MAPSIKRTLTVLTMALTLGVAGSAFATKSKPKPPKASAPEFDGKASGSAAALLLGGVLLLVDRRRRKTTDDKKI